MTMVSGIDTVSDVDVIMALDFEPEIPCEARDGCKNPAAWMARCRGCSWPRMFCVDCRVMLEQIAAEWMTYPLATIECVKCGFKAAALEDMLEWSKVKGS